MRTNEYRGCGGPPTGVLDFLFTAGFEILLVALRGLAFSLLILSAPNGTKRLASLCFLEFFGGVMMTGEPYAYHCISMFNPGCKFDWIIKSVPRHVHQVAVAAHFFSGCFQPWLCRCHCGWLWVFFCGAKSTHSTLQARNRTAQ